MRLTHMRSREMWLGRAISIRGYCYKTPSSSRSTDNPQYIEAAPEKYQVSGRRRLVGTLAGGMNSIGPRTTTTMPSDAAAELCRSLLFSSCCRFRGKKRSREARQAAHEHQERRATQTARLIVLRN